MGKISGALVLGLAMMGCLSGCGRFARAKVPAAKSNAGPAPETRTVPDFAHLWIHETSVPMLNNVDSFIAGARGEGEVPVRTAQFFNTTKQSVVIWLKSKGSIRTQGAWIGVGYSIYKSEATYGLVKLRVTYVQSGAVEEKSLVGDWTPIVLGPQQSVQVQWFMGLTDGFLLCNDEQKLGLGSGRNGRYDYFQVTGNLSREIRVAPIQVSEVEATADTQQLDPREVFILRQDTIPLISASSGGLPSWSQPYTRRGLCPDHI